MPRPLKQPNETPFYHFINVNPRGIRTGDCVIRAIARATGQDWDTVFDGLVEVAKRVKSVPNDKKCYETYLNEIGWKKHPAPRHNGNHRYKGLEFAPVMDDNCIINIGGHHLSCIVDNKINDIWNCSYGAVGNYWVKEV